MDDIFIVEISTPIKYHQVWYGQFLFFYQNLNALFQKKKSREGGGGGGGVRKEFLGVKKEHVKVKGQLKKK